MFRPSKRDTDTDGMTPAQPRAESNRGLAALPGIRRYRCGGCRHERLITRDCDRPGLLWAVWEALAVGQRDGGYEGKSDGA
jgi:hypothetical protein